MRIDLFMTPQEIPIFYTKGRRVVIVDVLRSCTTLSYALCAGAAQVIPVDSIEAAKQLLESLDRESSLLAGEQDGNDIDGFNLGNSPLDYEGKDFTGKTIVYVSDNGGPIMSRSMEALEKLLLAFVNMDAVVSYLQKARDEELTIICSGTEGRFCMEDTVAAGMLLELLAPKTEDQLNDAARAAWILYRAHSQDVPSVVRSSSHGRFLIEHDAEPDVEVAAQVSGLEIVPVAKDGRITAAGADA